MGFRRNSGMDRPVGSEYGSGLYILTRIYIYIIGIDNSSHIYIYIMYIIY